jgi:enoyl-CoA hydratase/carnithine racemase
MINVNTENHIMLIEVDRVKKLNALTIEMYSQMAKAYYELDTNDDLWVGLIYAKGPHFTSGIDLAAWSEQFAKGTGNPVAPEGEIDPYAMNNAVYCRKPLVMAVQGYCFTWGFELLLNTEIRVAATDTRFCAMEVRRGFFPTGGGTLRLPKEIGWGNANRYILTGEEMTAEEAYRLGLVQFLTEPGKQFDKALEVARRIASVAPLGVQGALKHSRITYLKGEDAVKDVLWEDTSAIMKSEDMKEGVQSFLERRPAVFKGK